jgi:hypothetical protein
VNQFETYDPFEEMHEYYRLDNPTEAEQFRFVEAMEYAINNSVYENDIIACSYNLAMYYRNIKDFRLEKKYLEIGNDLGSPFSMEQLGVIWYYGLCGEQDYEKAYHCFHDCGTRRGKYMLADMYHDGRYVEKDISKCQEILDELFIGVESERTDPRFIESTLFPEIALRLVKLRIEKKEDTVNDLTMLMDARDIIVLRQKSRPFWGNIQVMEDILKTMVLMVGSDHYFVDLYDLLTLTANKATVSFKYGSEELNIEVFTSEAETIYQYDGRWFHGAVDFLEKACVGGKRITTVIDELSAPVVLVLSE